MPEAPAGIRLYRLVKQKYARQALRGRGGLEADGRWHTAGRLVVYLASSEALAVLEVRVHLGSVIPVGAYAMLTIELPRRLVEVLPRERWPSNWDAVPNGPETQQLGDRWLSRAGSAALRVPSIHSSSDFNILLNPVHPQASVARIVARRRYAFDVRLF